MKKLLLFLGCCALTACNSEPPPKMYYGLMMGQKYFICTAIEYHTYGVSLRECMDREGHRMPNVHQATNFVSMSADELIRY